MGQQGSSCGDHEPLVFWTRQAMFGILMDDLVMAMPCREFIALRGFSPRIDLAVLDSLQDDPWFAVLAAVQADPTAVVVHLGLMLLCAGQVLVDGDGRFLREAPIPPEAMGSRSGLAALKALAELRTQDRLGVRGRVELAGLVHEPRLLPRQLLLVYRCVVPPGTGAGEGTWKPPTELRALHDDWLERTVMAAIPGASVA